MEETNMSVPKANSNESDTSSKGKNIAKNSVSNAAAAGAQKAGAVSLADKAIATAGAKATKGLSSLFSKAGNAIGKLAGNTLGKLGHLAGKAVHGITHIGQAAAGGITHIFGGLAAGASSVVSATVTTVVVGTTVLAGSAAMSNSSTIAVITDDVIEDTNCYTRTGGGSSSSSSSDTSFSTAEQQKNAYIIYTTLYQWITKSGSSNAKNQAIGILVNIYRECGYNPGGLETASGSIGPTDYDALAAYKNGIGLMQWTGVGNELVAYFKPNNMPWNTLESQLKLLTSEHDPLHGRMVEYIERTSDGTSAHACVVDFLENYERPAIEYQNKREAEADTDIGIVTSDVANYEKNATSEDESMIKSILSYASDLASGSGTGAGLSSYQNNPNCRSSSTTGLYDNSSIAKAAASLACPTEDEARGSDGTELYRKICKAVHGNNVYYKSCDRLVSAAIAWSGADDDIANCFGVLALKNHFESSDRWQKVGSVEFDNNGYPTNCQPGDVLLIKDANNSHVVIYTGNEIIKQAYPKSPDTFNIVSASLDERAAGCGVFNSSYSGYTIYRCINPQNSTTYANAAN